MLRQWSKRLLFFRRQTDANRSKESQSGNDWYSANSLKLLGESNVGKTNIARRLAGLSFDPSMEATIGAGFVNIKDDKTNGSTQYQIWDTAGQGKALSPLPREPFTLIVPYHLH